MRRYKNIYLFFILILFLIQFTRGQNPYFKTILTNSDIENSQFNCIYQDYQGFIWLGTDEGAYRFDGHELTLVYLPDTMATASITAIFQDQKNTLWFGTKNGKVLNYTGFEEFTMPATNLTISSRITSFIECGDGEVWAGTYGEGVIVFNIDSIYQINSSSGLSDNFIYSMIIDDRRNIWLGTDNGINICDISVAPFSIKTVSVKDGLPDYIVHSLIRDKKGNIWIGMHDKGVCFFDAKNNSFHQPDALKNWNYGVVNALLLLDNRLWIATDGKGVVDYNMNRETINVNEPCAENKLIKIISMLEDAEGNVWLLSNQKICISLAVKIEFLNSWENITINNIHALTVDLEDDIWFANDQGIFQYNPDEKKKDKNLQKHQLSIDPQTQKIMSLYRDVFGFIWAGTFGQGIIRLDPKTGRQVQLSESDGLVNNNVLSISGNATEIWFGTLGGASKILVNNQLHKLNYKAEFINYGKAEGLVNSYIYQVYMSPEGIPYFATDGSGVVILKDDKFHTINNSDRFTNKIIYSITSDRFGNIWMNAANDGLYKYNGNELTKVINDPEHKNLSFSGIICNKEELIILYDEGVDVMNIKSGLIKHFENNAGIQLINPDLNTISIDSKDNAWIGTAKGIIKYQQSSDHVWAYPQTRLTNVALFLKDINHHSKTIFNYHENHFTFGFTGLWFQYPEKVEYYYKLEGHDLTWIKTKNNRAVYSDLKPGKYTFRARAGIYDNYSETNEVVYKFEIQKPFYASIWFYFLLIIILGIIIYLVVKLRIKQVKKQEEIIQERIRFQFENLKSQINPHFLFNNFSTLVALIETDSKKAVEYVEELSILFRNVLEYKDQDLIRFSEELTIARNYLNIQQKRFGDSLIIETKKSPDFEKILIPPLTLQLIVENAIKHNIVSKEKPLTIKIYSDPEKKCIFVENNLQSKKENVASTGIGINNIVNRYKLLSDKQVEIKKSGTHFIVGLPYILK
ncbi:MAG: two-component regulator propeller domain-containing protein [Bacteroidales bacterium]